MSNFKTPKGYKIKKINTPSFSRLHQFIEFLLGQYSMLYVDDRGKMKDLVWKISDRSIKFHIKYMLPSIFSNVHEANF